MQPTPHKTTHTKTDTIEVTANVVAGWTPPPFQRALRVNGKVLALVAEIRADGGVIPGVLTLGVLNNATYLLDGQHRVHAFTLTEMKTGYADVRTLYCTTMAEMGDEFVKLNSRLVNFRPDDILKGLEASSEVLQLLRKRCPYLGYDNVRRNDRSSPILGMSQALRCWDQSAADVPAGSGASASVLVDSMTVDEVEHMIAFLGIAMEAWGRDAEYYRLWGGLNLSLCMWLYRRLVITQYSPNTARLTKEQFRKCLMSLSADSSYADWLTGRNVNDRDRSPAYSRLKTIFANRIEADTGKKPRLPGPAWASHSGGGPTRTRRS